MAKNEESAMMRQYNDMKKQKPDSLLLFRCGDFYETYQEDAKECAKILGITLTMREGGYDMAGFPHHALDQYLPMLIRAGKRVAICDQLPDPPKKPAKRGITELVNANENANQNQNDNQNQKEDKDMTTTFKAADLIGKTIILGATGAKYVVKSVNGDKLECDFSNGKATIPMSVPVSQAQKFLASGTWKIEGAIANENENQNENKATATDLKPADVKPETKDMSIRTEADVAEVDDILPVVTPSVKAKPAENTGETKIVVARVPRPGESADKPKVKPSAKSEVRSKTADVPQTSDIKPQTSKGKLTYSTYDVKKVDKKTKKEYTVTRAKISGMATDDAAYVNAVSLHASASYEVVDGKKVYILAFSHRYAAAAKDVCEALNAGKSLEDCQAIIAKATEERAAKIEAHKAKRKAKAQTSDVSPQTSKVYTQAELAEWLRKLNAGTDKEKAEAAKFFNDLAKAA